VKAYYLTELGILRESTRAKIHHRLEALSDQDENKAAAVKACQVLIADDPEYDRRVGTVTSPGLVIQIVNSPAPREHVTTIDIKPEPAPASQQLFVPGRDEPIDEDATVFRSPWDRPR
jgi:hypothetical protein